MTTRADRYRAIAAVILLHLVVGAALIRGFEIDVTRPMSDALQVFRLPAAPPPPPPEPARLERREAARAPGEAAPPALEARPKPVVAPEPRVRLSAPSKLAAPEVAADGDEASSGASPTPGPGTGAGGQGSGTGAGGSGTGSGGGGLGQRTPARLLSGEIAERDYPKSAWREDLARRVGVRFTVGPDGRASACRVVSTSGSPRVDAITCRVIEQTFRYAPARDDRGEPTSAEMVWTQVLWTERD